MIMNKNEIKKILYKEKPTAYCTSFSEGVKKYSAETSTGMVKFEVPVSDMGNNIFSDEESAQLLIRWITMPS